MCSLASMMMLASKLRSWLKRLPCCDGKSNECLSRSSRTSAWLALLFFGGTLESALRPQSGTGWTRGYYGGLASDLLLHFSRSARARCRAARLNESTRGKDLFFLCLHGLVGVALSFQKGKESDSSARTAREMRRRRRRSRRNSVIVSSLYPRVA